jgi:hypothetical protein
MRMGDHVDYSRHPPSFFGIEREQQHGEYEDEDEDMEYDEDEEDLDELWDDDQGGWWPNNSVRSPTDFGKSWDQAEHGLVRCAILFVGLP